MNPVRILFLAANPSDTAQLKTDEERRRIEAEILKSPHRDRIQLIYEPAIRPNSLIEVFRRHRPQIIHFSGHGSEANEIILESDDGSSRLVGTDTLAELFRLQGKGVRIVLLNACYSRPQAEALTHHVDFAIGMSEAIPDPMAIDFASAFYQGLAYGEPVRSAFDSSLLQLRLTGLPRLSGPGRELGSEVVKARGLIPELVARQGTDASRAIIIDEFGPTPSTISQTPGEGSARATGGLRGRLASRVPGGLLTLISGPALLGVITLVFLAGKQGLLLSERGGNHVAMPPPQPDAKGQPGGPTPAPAKARENFNIVDVYNGGWTGSGSATGVDGTKYEYARIFDASGGGAGLWTHDACVFTFDCGKNEIVPSLLIKGINVIAQDFRPPPPFEREHFAAVERAHVYYCEIAPPKGDRNVFPAVLLDANGKPTQQEVVRLRDSGEEAFKVRINTKTPGLYTIRCEMVVGYHDVVQTVRLCEPRQYLFGTN